jgi:hypothetical protein
MKIQKDKLDNFIKKYNLRKENESVKFTLSKEKGTWSVRVKSMNNSMVGEIQMNGLSIDEDTEFGIYDTHRFKRLSDVFSGEIDINFIKNANNTEVCSVSMTDGITDVNCMTAKIAVIPKVPVLKKIPDPTFSIVINKKMSDSIKSAMAGLFTVKDTIQNFTLVPKNGKVSMIINHSSDSNSNKVKFPVQPEAGFDTLSKEMSFSADLLNEILLANSDYFTDEKSFVTLKVSEVGISMVFFETPDFSCKYYLTELATAK